MLPLRDSDPQFTMPAIFISYRREDSSGHTGRIYDGLRERFGEDCVFRDIDTIEPGTDFVEAVEQGIQGCSTLIVVIGKHWLAAADELGRRLDDPNDFVRLEIASALRKGMRVIPVLIKGASMPSGKALPEDIAPLARRHALELSDSRWDYDMGRLIDTLEKLDEANPPPVGAPFETHENAPEKSHRSFRFTGLLGIAALVAAIPLFAWLGLYPSGGDPPPTTARTSAHAIPSTPTRSKPDKPPPQRESTSSASAPATTAAPGRTDDKPKHIEALKRRAAANLKALRLTIPKGNNALEDYQAILRLSPDDQEARDGLRKIARKYLELAHSALRKGKLIQASKHLDMARKVDANTPGMTSLTREIKTARQIRAAKEPVAVTPSTRETIPRTPSREKPPTTARSIKPAAPVQSGDAFDASRNNCIENCQNRLATCKNNAANQLKACLEPVKAACDKMEQRCNNDPQLLATRGNFGTESECLSRWHQCKEDREVQCQRLFETGETECAAGLQACQAGCRP